jgi:hypothetical protein
MIEVDTLTEKIDVSLSVENKVWEMPVSGEVTVRK